MVEQMESDKPISIFQAVSDTLTKNLLKALPIIFVWSTLWFLIACIEMLTKKRNNKESSEDRELNARNAARELANIQEFSLGTLFLDSLKQGIRMLAFLIFPAIAI
jgi:hypothetical protein